MTDDFSRPFIAIRREDDGGDFDRTMAEYLVNPLHEELHNVRISTSAASSDAEDGITTGIAPDTVHAVIPQTPRSGSA